MVFGPFAQALQRFGLAQGDATDVIGELIGDGV